MATRGRPVGKAAAARAEAAGQEKTIEFRGRQLTLPPELPGSLFFVWAEVKLDAEPSPAIIADFLRGALGDAQYAQVKDIVLADALSMAQTEEEIGNLVEAVNGAYGLDAGE